MKTIRILISALMALTAAWGGVSCASRSSPAGAEHFLARGGVAWSVPRESGVTVGGLIWRVPGRPKGVLLCLHGTQTHAAWFGPLAVEMNRAGWTVIAPDRRGSGTNRGKNFHPGHTRGAEELLGDVAAQLAEARREAGGKPVILVGTSWASNLATAHAASGRDPRPDGLIQIVPATEVKEAFSPGPIQRFALKVLSTVAPKTPKKLPFTNEHYLAGGDHRVADEMVLSVLERDTALIRKPTVRTLATGVALDEAWQANPGEVGGAIPALILTAARDQLMNNEAANAALPGATKRTIDTGHAAQITEPKALAREVVRWTEELFSHR